MSRGKVIKVISGKSVMIIPRWYYNGMAGSIICYDGVETPEKGEPGWEKALEDNRSLVEGKSVRFEERGIDEFMRLKAVIYVDDVCVNDIIKGKEY